MGGYSEETARKIFDKFYRQGWNIYKNNGNIESDIESGPIMELETNVNYHVLPVAENTRDKKQVLNLVHEFWKKDEDFARVILNGDSYELVGFMLKDDFVIIRPDVRPTVTHQSYDNFMNIIKGRSKINE